MRTYDEMLKLIMDFAESDERIRAVTMEGSSVNKESVRDQFSDFDICYYVSDSRPFTENREWIRYFGDILIMQCPDDWYGHRYEPDSRDKFTYLMQFQDGNRIDLTIIDISHIDESEQSMEPRRILLNKDQLEILVQEEAERNFYVKRPSEKEYFDTCNEFRWLSLYVSKGLCRQELYYAKYMYDVLMMKMFIKMLNFRVGADHHFEVSLGSGSKYLKRYLSAEEMERFAGIFANGDYKEIWEKLFLFYDYFAENAKYVAEKMGFSFDEEETIRVRSFLLDRKGIFDNLYREKDER